MARYENKTEAFERSLHASIMANDQKIREILVDAAELITAADRTVFNELQTAIDGETAEYIHSLIIEGVIKSLFDSLIEGYLIHSEENLKRKS